MAKDPAVLWYFNDWNGGVSTMNRYTKGAYMDLLYAQWNNGPLSIQQIKNVLGPDFEREWPELSIKFAGKDEETGKIFNVKLHEEMTKRKRFSESRRQNRAGSKSTSDTTHDKTYVQSNDEHMVNVNVIGNIELELNKENREVFKKLYSSLNFQKAWWAWVEYRKERKQSLKGPKMMAGQINRIIKLSKGETGHAIALIENAIESGWQGIFPIKDYSKAKKVLRDQHGFRQG